jgi:hypothetical protein
MATKKRKTRATTGIQKEPFQTDDPIIIKPGSLTLEWDDAGFTDVYTPGGTKKGKKHPIAKYLTKILILDKSDVVKVSIQITDPKDQVVICYDKSKQP